MKLSKLTGHRSDIPSRTHAFLALLAGCCLGMATSAAIAQSFPQMDAYAPDGSTILENYGYDRAYGAAGITYDRFSDSSSKNYSGQKIARLDNGDVVVAGLVPRGGAFSVANQIGLVKYSPSGQRQTWANIDPTFSRNNGQYIVYPNAGSGQPSGAFIEVVGLETHGGNIYVMANEQSANGAIHPIIMVFASNGFFRGWWTYSPGGDANKPGRGFTISGSKLIVLGNDTTPSDIPTRPRIWMSRYTIDANGGLSFDSSFGDGGFAFYRAYACTVAATAFPCSTYAGFEGIKAQAGVVILASPKFYVAVTVTGSGTPSYDSVVVRFNGNGSRDTNFGVSSTGYDSARIAFDDGGDNADYAVALQTDYHVVIPLAYVDDIFLTVSVSRSILRGIGVARFNGDGDLVTSFGAGGKILFGGCGSGAGNCTFVNVEEVPWSMVKDGKHLAIGGWYRGYDDNAHTIVRFTYPMLAVVNSDTGAIENLSGYSALIGNAALYGIVANGDGSFTGGGAIREVAAGSNLSYFSARFQSNDVIFHNGFN